MYVAMATTVHMDGAVHMDGLHTSFKTWYLISNAFVNTGCAYVGYLCSLYNRLHIKFTETWNILEIFLLASL